MCMYFAYVEQSFHPVPCPNFPLMGCRSIPFPCVYANIHVPIIVKVANGINRCCSFALIVPNNQQWAINCAFCSFAYHRLNGTERNTAVRGQTDIQNKGLSVDGRRPTATGGQSFHWPRPCCGRPFIVKIIGLCGNWI